MLPLQRVASSILVDILAQEVSICGSNLPSSKHFFTLNLCIKMFEHLFYMFNLESNICDSLTILENVIKKICAGCTGIRTWVLLCIFQDPGFSNFPLKPILFVCRENSP